MNILFLNYEFPPLGGGASPVSYEIAKGYVKLGHNVDVITMGFKDLPSYEVKEGIRIYRVRCMRSRKEICHPWEQLSYIHHAKSLIKSMMVFAKDGKLWDICHCHFIIPTGVIALWLKERYGIPYVISSHGADVLGYNKRFKFLYPLLKGRWNRIVYEAEKTFFPSQFLMSKAIEHLPEYFNYGNLQVLPHGIDASKFKPKSKANTILIVARLFENKGVQDIINAFWLVRDDLLNYDEINIVGDGPYREALEEQLERYTKMQDNNDDIFFLKDIIKFHGWLDRDSRKMKELYARARIFISASYFESFGMTVLEALAAKCIPILSDIESHKSILRKSILGSIQGNDSNFFELANVQDLARRIGQAIKGNLPIIPLSKDFAWPNIVKKYESVLKEGMKMDYKQDYMVINEIRQEVTEHD